MGERSKNHNRYGTWCAIHFGQGDNVSPPGPQTQAIMVFIISLQNVLEMKEIALLLVPDVLMLALGKILHAHPPSPPHVLPWIKCSDLMGIPLIAWVAHDHPLAAPEHSSALLASSLRLSHKFLSVGACFPARAFWHNV